MKLTDLLESTRTRGAQAGFLFGARVFDRIEVGAVRRKNHSCAPDLLRSLSRTSGCLCTARLTSTTTSPGRSVGTRTCSTYASNVGLSIGPSNTASARQPLKTQPRHRRCASAVPLRLCDRARATPLGLRPLRRSRSVVTSHSSRHTYCRTSSACRGAPPPSTDRGARRGAFSRPAWPDRSSRPATSPDAPVSTPLRAVSACWPGGSPS